MCNFIKWKNLTKKDIIPWKIPIIAWWQKPISFHNEWNREWETIAVSSSGAYSGFVSYWNEPVFLTDAFSIHPNEGLKSKYVFYFLKNSQDKIYWLQKGSGVPHVYSKDIAKIQIPIPPREVQERIVKILDNFDNLVNDISVWLPAEIEKRRKQYEYFREKLLTFR